MGDFNSYKKNDDGPKIKVIGVFDFDKVYDTINSLYSEFSYLTTEKKYIQKAGGSGDEVEVEIYGFRNETEYVQFELTAYIHVWDMQDVEIEVNGGKKTLQKGRLQVDFSTNMKTDYTGEFEKTSFLKKLKNVYEKKLIAGNLWVQYDDKMYYEMYKFHAAVKEVLDSYSAYNAF